MGPKMVYPKSGGSPDKKTLIVGWLVPPWPWKKPCGAAHVVLPLKAGELCDLADQVGNPTEKWVQLCHPFEASTFWIIRMKMASPGNRMNIILIHTIYKFYINYIISIHFISLPELKIGTQSTRFGHQLKASIVDVNGFASSSESEIKISRAWICSRSLAWTADHAPPHI